MIKRPQRTDTEDDILRMQEEFIAEKNKDPAFAPAAKVVKIAKPEDKKVSKFAIKRGLNPKATNEEPPPESKILFGDIVEKINSQPASISATIPNEIGFPEVEKISLENISINSRKSIFAQNMEAKIGCENTQPKINIDRSIREANGLINNIEIKRENIGMDIDELAHGVHEENLNTLKSMSEKEILEERQKLIDSLDPKLIDLFKSRNKPSVQPSQKIPYQMKSELNEIPEIDLLNDKNSKKWLNFDVVEPQKLEWMKNISKNYPKLKPDEQYEARFDWKGFLLPYTQESKIDNRELYLHGEDAHRPGYTLQELFRLARSNILQQRISALNSIAGILNIYNQGYYDNVLELPITKIFFLLRYSLDENSLAVLEPTCKALATLFYNEVDETLLDVIFESPLGIEQPILKISPDENSSNIEQKMSSLNLNESRSQFSSNIDEDSIADIATMNDFHLAETDLVQCLLRTNILERIRYILQTIKPDNTTVTSCLKILFAIVRSNHQYITRIIQLEDLLKALVDNFLPVISNSNALSSYETRFYNKPQCLLIKLLRYIASTGIKSCILVKKFENIEDRLKSYVFFRDDINENLIQIQIETFRLIKVWAIYFRGDDFYRSLLPALRFLMEWHYQFLDIQQSNHYLIRQHAAALIALLDHCVHSEFIDLFSTIFVSCFNKWCDILMQNNNTLKEFSQSMLLVTCVNTSKLLLESGYGNFKFLEKFLQSNSFDKFCSNLSTTSILLSSNVDRSKTDSPLPNLGSIVFSTNSNNHPSLIIQQNYPFILLTSLIELYSNHLTNSNQHIQAFLERFSNNQINENLKLNWFSKFELQFILNYLTISKNSIEKSDFILKISYKLLSCLTGNYYEEIQFVLDNFIFSSKFYSFEDSNSQLLEHCYIDYLNLLNQSITLKASWNEIVLPSYWPYLPLFLLYKKSQNPVEVNISENFTDENLIKMTVNFLTYLERKVSIFFTPNDYLISLMLPYFSIESKFLDSDIKSLLHERLGLLKNLEFNFNVKLMNDKLAFETFYLSFLEQFQGMSYGDEIFSSLVMLPLQQKYDIKWRKIVWSEYVAVLRFINCNETELIGTIDDYLHPVETDVSLLKCYNQALKTNILRVDSIPYKIAEYHVKQYLMNNKSN